MSTAATAPGSLLRWALRSHRRGALGLGAGLGLIVLILGPSYVAAAKVIAGGLQTLAAQALPFARQFAFLTGPVERLDTVGGYLSYKIFGSIALVVALYAAVQGAQVIRGAETKGILDLWFASGRPRAGIFDDRVRAFGAALVAIIVLIYLGTGISGALSDETLWASGVGQCVAVGVVGAVGFAVGMLASQLAGSARTAAGASCVAFVATYFVANIADSLGPASFLRFLSPFFYYLQERTLVPGTSFDVVAAVVPLAAAGVALLAARQMFIARDIGGTLFALRIRARPADHTMHTSRVVRRWLWLAWVWEQRLAIATWCAGIFVLTAVEAGVVPTAINLVHNDHGTLANLAAVAAITPAQYVAFLLGFVMVVVAAFAVTEVANWVGDASQHRTDTLLTAPVGLARYAAQRLVSIVVMSALLAAALVLGALIGAAAGGYSLDIAGLLRTFVDALLFGVAVGGVGLLLATGLRGGAATAVMGAFVVVCFLLTTVSGLLHWPDWTNRPSVFDAFGSPYLGWPAIGSLLYLGLLGAAGATLSYVVLQRGDRVA